MADAETLEKSTDPVIVLARTLVPELEALEDRDDADSGRQATLGPRYFAMLRAVRKGPVYPDANSTLRFSYASLTGYSPKEGLVATPRTTLSGLIAKETGKVPFIVPARLKELAPAAKRSGWADAALGDLPIDFLTNGDTTGGNSGSPVINGAGELVGLNFDRVWENVAGDFGYDPARSRNVVVDVRYLLWLLDAKEDAGALLSELGVAGLRGKSVGENVRGGAPAAAGSAGVVIAKSTSGSCGCGGGQAAALGGVLGLVRALLARRRRRVS